MTDLERLKKEKFNKEERKRELTNMISSFAVKHHFTMEAIDECVEKVADVFYTDGLISRDI